MSIQKSRSFAYLMWVIPLLFFTYQFILRLWPGLMMQAIMQQFSIDASHFGLMAAFYYYGYAGMQIPVALLLERFGTRIIVCVFAIMCGAATLVFTYTDNWILACLSRFLVGAGSAAGFLSVSKVISEWFPKEHYTRMISFSFTLGLMGAIYGGKPISSLTANHPWQLVALVLALISMIIGMIAFCILRPSKITNKKENSFQISYFKTLLTSPFLWLLAISNLLMVGALEGFSDIWGVPYLMLAFSISKNKAAELISFVFFGMLIGGPLLSYFSKKIGNYSLIVLCGIGMALIFMGLLQNIHYRTWELGCLFFILGILCCYQVIVFSAGADLVSVETLGVTIAFLNCINMLGGSFFHTIIGFFMDLLWTGTVTSNGVKHYTLEVYQSALLVIPGCALLGAIILSLLSLIRRKQIIFLQKETDNLVSIN